MNGSDWVLIKLYLQNSARLSLPYGLWFANPCLILLHSSSLNTVVLSILQKYN